MEITMMLLLILLLSIQILLTVVGVIGLNLGKPFGIISLLFGMITSFSTSPLIGGLTGGGFFCVLGFVISMLALMVLSFFLEKNPRYISLLERLRTRVEIITPARKILFLKKLPIMELSILSENLRGWKENEREYARLAPGIAGVEREIEQVSKKQKEFEEEAAKGNDLYLSKQYELRKNDLEEYLAELRQELERVGREYDPVKAKRNEMLGHFKQAIEEAERYEKYHESGKTLLCDMNHAVKRLPRH